MSSAEFTDWQEFYALEPFGDRRLDFAAAQICAQVGNAYRDQEKHPEPFTAVDFLTLWTEAERQAMAARESAQHDAKLEAFART